MKKMTAALAISTVLALTSAAHAGSGKHSFSFHATDIGNAVFMTGGGTYDPGSGFLQGAGGFHCRSDITGGPLAGLRAGEGVRWEAAEILASSGFKCSGPDPLKTAVTDDDTIVMQVRFFRQGDGANASFTAKVFVSAVDENPDEVGSQTVWIQGVGCDEAEANVR